MPNVSKGFCTQCQKIVVALVWGNDDQVKVRVGCSHCKIDAEFDLEELYSTLVACEGPDYVKMLQDFIPVGKPN